MTAVREMPVSIDADNVAYVEGTTTKVVEVVAVKQAQELTPEELQKELPHLTLAQIYGALAYYHAHKTELDAQIESRFQFADNIRIGSSGSLTREDLQTRQSSK